MSAHNDFGAPSHVVPAALSGISVRGDRVTLVLPAKSDTVLAIE